MTSQPKKAITARPGNSIAIVNSISTSNMNPKKTRTTTTAAPPDTTKKRGSGKGSRQQYLPETSCATTKSKNCYENDEEDCQCSVLDDDGSGTKHESRAVCEADKIRRVHVDICMSIILTSPHTTTLLVGPDSQPFTVYTNLLKLHTIHFSGNPESASSASASKTKKRSSHSLPEFRIPKKMKVDKENNQDSERQPETIGVPGQKDCSASPDVKDDVKAEVKAGVHHNTEEKNDQDQNFKVEDDRSNEGVPEIKHEPNQPTIGTPPQTPSPQPPMKEPATLFEFPPKTTGIKIETAASLSNFEYPTIDPLNFAYFHSWIMTGILIPSLSRLVEHPSAQITTRTLITLHVFAQTIKSIPFGVFILQTLLNHPLMTSNKWPTPADARLIYSLAPASSILRKLCADCVANKNPFDQNEPSSAIYKEWERIFSETKIGMDFAKSASTRWQNVNPWNWSERKRYRGDEGEEIGIEERWEEMLKDGEGDEKEIMEQGMKVKFAKRVESEFLRSMKLNSKKRKRVESMELESSDENDDA
ncbi:hypothetical protein EYC80_001988 [Monilinia laxa]|uniref:Uncharacterized protein n=1 Tax=Monilinia laxa TaxID=61186 RepID=A0A5N6K6P2_MONLA|nr:hypothetical protein EYC80_001988 [Monilinia laxa]